MNLRKIIHDAYNIYGHNPSKINAQNRGFKEGGYYSHLVKIPSGGTGDTKIKTLVNTITHVFSKFCFLFFLPEIIG